MKKKYFTIIKDIILAIFLALLFRTFAFEICKVPTGSMIGTLLIGDHILVSKYDYGFSPFSTIIPLYPIIEKKFFTQSPKRGDIVIFQPPGDPKKYIKRLIGLPGDEIQLIQGIMYINGQRLERKQIGNYTAPDGTILMKFKEYNHSIEYFIFEDQRVPKDTFPNTTHVYKVPAQHYFLMGDNRDHSGDSRFSNGIGYVPEISIIGRARYVLWNSNTTLAQLFRVERIIQLIK